MVQATEGQFGVVRRIAAARLVSHVGNQLQLIALPLILVADGYGWSVPLAFCAEYLPFLFLAGRAGVLADSFPRLVLMALSDAGRAAVVAGLAVTASLGNLTPTVVLPALFLAGALTCLDEASGRAEVVDRAGNDLRPALARLEVAQSIAMLVGPAAAAVLLALRTPEVALWVDAATYAVSGLICASAFVAYGPLRLLARGPEPQAPSSSPITAGAFVRRNTVLRTLAGIAVAQAVFMSLGFGVLIVYLSVELGFTNTEIALVSMGTAVGGIVGGRVVGRRAETKGDSSLGGPLGLRASALGAGLTIMAVAAAPSVGLAFVLVAVCQMLGGIWMCAWRVHVGVLRAEASPPEMRGRVEAHFAGLTFGARPFGFLAGSALLALTAPRPTIVFAAGGFLATCVWAAVVLPRDRNEHAAPRGRSVPKTGGSRRSRKPSRRLNTNRRNGKGRDLMSTSMEP